MQFPHFLLLQGVKEHKCRICGREFTLLANMKRHVLIHTNIRAYQCHMCFKSFVQKQTLKAHMIVHSDIKPYKCKVSRQDTRVLRRAPPVSSALKKILKFWPHGFAVWCEAQGDDQIAERIFGSRTLLVYRKDISAQTASLTMAPPASLENRALK